MKIHRWNDIKHKKTEPMIDPKKLEAALAEVAKSPIPDEMFLAAYNVIVSDPYFCEDYTGSLSELVEEMLVAAVKSLTTDDLTNMHLALLAQISGTK